MRLTQSTLKEYIEIDQLTKELLARKAQIREAIIEQGQQEFTIGEYTVKITESVRLSSLPIAELKQVTDKIDPKLFDKVTKEQSFERVSVKKTGSSLKLAALALMTLVTGLSIGGCATPRTKWTDKTMRVMIDPEGVSAKHYVRIQQALMKSGKWVVVDRGMGYNAIKKEQEREHREQTDRFLDSEKFAHWGKLYGVGGVIVAHSSCVIRDGLFKKNFPTCNQYVAIVDANTGEVIAAAEGQEEGSSYDYDLAPSWDDVVADMEAAYPENYQPNKDHKILRDYKELSQEEATRQKEELARKIASEKE